MLPCKLLPSSMHTFQMLFCSVLPCLALEWTPQYPHRLSIASPALWILLSAKTVLVMDLGRATTSTLMLYLAQTNCQVRLTEYFLWERGCLSLKSSPFSLRILWYVICSVHREKNNLVVEYKEWTGESPIPLNPGEQRWWGLGTLLKMS